MYNAFNKILRKVKNMLLKSREGTFYGVNKRKIKIKKKINKNQMRNRKKNRNNKKRKRKIKFIKKIRKKQIKTITKEKYLKATMPYLKVLIL